MSAGDERERALLDVHRAAYLLYTSVLGDPLGKAVRHERSGWLNEFRSRYEATLLVGEIVEIATHLPTPEESRSTAHLTRWLLRTLEDVPATGQSAPHLDAAEMFLCPDPLHFAFGVCVPEGGPTLRSMETRPWEKPDPGRSTTAPWRGYADINLLFVLATNREHHFKAIGAWLYQNRAVPASHYPASEDCAPPVASVIESVISTAPRAGMELAIGAALRMSALGRKWLASPRVNRPAVPRARAFRQPRRTGEPIEDVGHQMSPGSGS